MENGILVSVIIPVFNVKPYLCEALDSVLSQTYRNLEIIIVDDGSTDGSGEICDVYAKKDPRFRVFHQANQGQSSARNTALDRMTGDVVAFLDSDDAYHPDFIQTMLLAMQRQNADLVVCQFSVQFTEGPMQLRERDLCRPPMKAGLYDRSEALRAVVDVQIDVSMCNKLYRSELWSSIRFSEGHIFEDLDVFFRIVDQCGTVYVLGRPLYLCRCRTGSTMRSRCTEKLIRDRMLADSHFDSYVAAHTPEIFTPQHMKTQHQMRHSDLMRIYFRFTSDAENRGNPAGEELRQWIIASVKEYGTRGIRNKTASFLLRFSPWLFRIVFSAYLTLRFRVRDLTGR